MVGLLRENAWAEKQSEITLANARQLKISRSKVQGSIAEISLLSHSINPYCQIQTSKQKKSSYSAVPIYNFAWILQC